MSLFNPVKKKPNNNDWGGWWGEQQSYQSNDTELGDMFGLRDNPVRTDVETSDILMNLIDKSLEIYCSCQADDTGARKAVQQLRNLVEKKEKDPAKVFQSLSTIFAVLGHSIVVELFNNKDEASLNKLVDKLLGDFQPIEITEESKYIDFGTWGNKTNFSENQVTGEEAKIASQFKIWLANNDASPITTVGKFKKMWDSFKSKNKSYMIANVDKVWAEYEKIR